MGIPVEKIVGAAVAGGSNTVKAVFGLMQRSKANAELNRLRQQRPVYENKNIKNLVSLYQRNAGISQYPGQESMESRLGATTAESIGSAAKYAPSSTAMLGAVSDVYGKRQNAIRDLATTFAQYKAQAQQQLGQAYQVAAQDEAEAWNINKLVPWQTRMNELVSERQAGSEALWSGLEGIAASGFALAGSSYQGSSVGGQQNLSSGQQGGGGGMDISSMIGAFQQFGGNQSSVSGSAGGASSAASGASAAGGGASGGSPGH